MVADEKVCLRKRPARGPDKGETDLRGDKAAEHCFRLSWGWSGEGDSGRSAAPGESLGMTAYTKGGSCVGLR